MARKLASIRIIDEIKPIEKADKIEVAVLGGWECVVKKGDFKKNDLAIYVEIDSILPDKPEFDFMRKRKFRVKTIKLRGQISQGLVFPLDILPDKVKPKEGMDVTKILGVKKYDPFKAKPRRQQYSWKKNKWNYIKWRIKCWLQKLGLLPKNKKTFPGFLRKTDEERCQNIRLRAWEEMANEPVFFTEKIDGQSATFYKYKRKFGVCSRNIDIPKRTTDSMHKRFWNSAIKYKLKDKLPNGYAVQCEQYGVGIQGNKYGLEDVKLACFNVFDIEKQQYLDYKEWLDFCKKIDLPVVPILQEDTMPEEPRAKYFLELSKGNSVLNKKVKREGIVIRGIKNKIIYGLGRFSFKAINNEFLLKYEELDAKIQEEFKNKKEKRK